MKKITKIIMIAVAILILSPVAYHFYWMTRGFLEPDIVRHGLQRYRKLSSEYLIKKLHSISPYDVYTALDVLAERKEKKAVPQILKFLKSPIKYKRDSAMRTLAEIGDERAIGPLIKIVKKGRKHPDYIDALHVLATLHYEPVYPLVLELALLDPIEDSKDDNRSSGVTMLQNFGKAESIPILQKIAKTDPEEYIRNKAKKAIKHIESLQKAKEISP